ncbi:hypothetical protein BLSTO_02781 [Blastocystis sp. subtype 1]
MIALLLVGILPLVVLSSITTIQPMRVDKPFYYTQSFSMLASKSVSGESESESGDSFIAVSLTLDKVVNTEDAFASAELLIVPEGMYNQIGYYDGDDHIVCCDEKAIRDGKCSTPGTLILHRVKDERFSYRNVSFTWRQRRSLMASGKKMLLNSRYNVKRDGQYYVVVAFCNPATKNAVLAGQTAALNPHGHLPAGVFGLLDFMRALTAVYTVLMLVWTAKCCQYRRELMSIHVLISAALLLLTLDALAHWAALAAYNADGAATRVGTALTVLLDALTSALLRCLVLVIAVGLGMSRATMGPLFCRVVLLTVLCFAVTLWYGAFPFLFPGSASVWSQLPSTAVDTLVYYLFLSWLGDTMDELERRSQTSKLGVFRTLRNASFVAIAALVAYSAAYGYLAAHDMLRALWKVEWLLNEGADSVFCLFVVMLIMCLWMPNDRSVAYASHLQVATDERHDAEEYAMPEVELQWRRSTSRGR